MSNSTQAVEIDPVELHHGPTLLTGHGGQSPATSEHAAGRGGGDKAKLLALTEAVSDSNVNSAT